MPMASLPCHNSLARGFRGIKDRNSHQSGSRSGLLALVSGTAGSISPEWVALKVQNNHPIAKLTSAIAGMTSTIIINSIINGLLTNVDMITSIGGAISGILDILFDKKLNNSILVL